MLVLGALAYLAVLASSLAAFAAGRTLVARMAGVTSARFPFYDGPPEAWASAPRWGVALLLVSGPLATYLFAALVFFASLMIGGVVHRDPIVTVIDGRPAAEGGVRSGDRVRSVGGVPTETWEDLAREVGAHPGEPVTVVVTRDDQTLSLEVVPSGEGKIGVMAATPGVKRRVGTGTALLSSVTKPWAIVRDLADGFVQMFTGRPSGELAGPAAIVKETANAGESGFGNLLYFLAALASYLIAPLMIVSAAITGRLAWSASRRRTGPEP